MSVPQYPHNIRDHHLHPVHGLLSYAFMRADQAHGDQRDGTIKDPENVIRFGRMWLVMLAIWNQINNHGPDNDISFEDDLDRAYSASDAEEIAIAMYG